MISRLPLLVSLLTLLVTSCQSPKQPGAPAERQGTVAKPAPNTTANRVAPTPSAFEAAERFAAAGETNKAIEAYLTALQRKPWSLNAQMTVAELLHSVGSAEAAREKATLVWDHAVTDHLLVRSARLLGREFDATLPEFEPWPDSGYALALVPISDVEVWLLQDLKKELQKRLEVPVVIRREPFAIPPPHQDDLNLRARDLRQKYTAMQSNPGFVRLLRVNNLSWTGQETDEEVITFAEKMTTAGRGDRIMQALGPHPEPGPRWEATALLNEFCAASGGSARHPQRLFLGFTGVDLYSKEFPYLGGIAQHNASCAVMSYRRFGNADPGEPPNRERLRERTLKQALSSIGSLLGIFPCKDRSCPRALPQNIRLLDARQPHLCSHCAEAFREQLKQ